VAKRIKPTRPELKKQRDALQRFERYLPMLKLKQQQLQMTIRKVQARRKEAIDAATAAEAKFSPYSAVLDDVAGVNVRRLAEPERVRTSQANVAGVKVPVFENVEFRCALYSLFATPTWVDQALLDMREISRHQARADVLEEQHRLLQKELTKIIQRVNLFEKVMIPDAREAIRTIRIHLGDEMTAAVGRAKIAKAKLVEEGKSEDGQMTYSPAETAPSPEATEGPQSDLP